VYDFYHPKLTIFFSLWLCKIRFDTRHRTQWCVLLEILLYAQFAKRANFTTLYYNMASIQVAEVVPTFFANSGLSEYEDKITPHGYTIQGDTMQVTTTRLSTQLRQPQYI
jgi:hypothetical protein